MKTKLKRIASISMIVFVMMSMLPLIGEVPGIDRAMQRAYAETEYKGVQPEPPDGFVYDIYAGESGGSILIAGYVGSDTQVVMPTSVTYNGVTYKAWDNNTGSAGNGYFSVTEKVFAGNTSIKEVAIPHGYQSISGGAFKGCTSLTEVAIADTVKYLGTDIFDDCASLTTYYFSGDDLLDPETGRTESQAVQMLIESGLGQDADGKPIGGITVYTKPGSVVEKAVDEINMNAADDSHKITVVADTDPYSKNTVTPESTAPSSDSNSNNNNNNNNNNTVPATSGGSKTPDTNTKTADNQKGLDGTAYGKGASEKVMNAAIAKYAKETDAKGTVFGLLKAKISRTTKNSLTLQWSKVKGAKKYVVYGNLCGANKKMVKQTTTGKTKLVVKKVSRKALRKGKYYKFIVVAIDKKGKVISTSKMVHAATKGGKAGNDKSITVNKKVKKNRISIKRGKTFRLNAKAVPESKKLKVSRHRGIAYESSNTGIATVTAKGVIKGKKKGSCTIYAYAQNGVCKAIKVTVK